MSNEVLNLQPQLSPTLELIALVCNAEGCGCLERKDRKQERSHVSGSYGMQNCASCK